MNLDEYQKLALQTAGDTSLPVCALGLAGEAGEVCQLIAQWGVGVPPQGFVDALAKELGDVLWYVAATAATLKTKMSDLATPDILAKRAGAPMAISVTALKLAGATGKAADIVKKHVGHGHSLSTEDVKAELSISLFFVAKLAVTFDLSLSDICRFNIQKLKRRYPDGFSQEASINRVI